MPLSIFRWPLAGALAAILADNLDIVIASLLDLGGLWNYHSLDKYLDTYYLGIEYLVCLRWEPLLRRTGGFLFFYRLIGVILFEVTGIRVFLFIFPAVFEFFFLYYAALKELRPRHVPTVRGVGLALFALLIPKWGQEYVLHYARWLDDVVAVEVIEDVAKAVLGAFADFFRLLTP